MSDLTAHFSWAEVTRSQAADAQGIDNSLPVELRPNVVRAAAMMELARDLLGGKPITVNSWYRCPALNTAIGSNARSVHPLGLAVDFEAPAGMTNREAFDRLTESDLLFDQLIHERTQSGANWIHLALGRGTPRRQVMVAAGKVLGGRMTFNRIAAG